MTAIRSHLTPDNIEGVKVGDDACISMHKSNPEQDWDVPHGFAIKGANNAEILIMPGETPNTLYLSLKELACSHSIAPISALHCTRKCRLFLRVSPVNSNVPLTFSIGTNKPATTSDSTPKASLRDAEIMKIETMQLSYCMAIIHYYGKDERYFKSTNYSRFHAVDSSLFFAILVPFLPDCSSISPLLEVDSPCKYGYIKLQGR